MIRSVVAVVGREKTQIAVWEDKDFSGSFAVKTINASALIMRLADEKTKIEVKPEGGAGVFADSVVRDIAIIQHAEQIARGRGFDRTFLDRAAEDMTRSWP